MNFRKETGRKLRCESLEKRVLLAAEILGGSEALAFVDPAGIWSDSSPVQAPLQDASRHAVSPEISPIKAQEFRLLSVDGDSLRSNLSSISFSSGGEASVGQTTLTVPRPDGTFDEFVVTSNFVMPPELSARFPEIKTFSGVSSQGTGDRLYGDLTPNGFHAMVLSTEGNYYVDPFYYFDDRLYASYFTDGEFLGRDLSQLDGDLLVGHDHDTEHQEAGNHDVASESEPGEKATASRTGTTLRTYRTAVAVTGEYTAFHGGTVQDGLAAVVTAMNRVSGVYESELTIRLQLVPNNDQLIYTDAASDPYSNNNGFALLGENQTNIDSVIGNSNYDVGHVFGTGGGGLAGLGVAGIDGRKAQGQTGDPSPINDSFYIDYVAHEVGHQFGGDHTFNGDSGACGGNANAQTAYEPGSGSTIQAYAGICGNDNLQNNSDAYFHSISFDQMIGHVDGVIPNVGTRTSTGNTVPLVDGGSNFAIPAGTPFTLVANGSDGDGDLVTYNWEQRDLGPQRDVNAPDDGQGPLFRSWTATTDPTRTFPRLEDLLAGTTTIGEQLPTTNRNLNFRVTARDNRLGGGGVATDDVLLNVVDTGAPFQVNEPNTAVSWPAFSRQNVTWDVAGTSGGSINANTVDILLSTDGGQTFDTTLASSVPNVGSHEVLVPNIQTTTARIKVKASTNIFFDLSDTNFTIDSPGDTQDYGDAPAPYPTLLADDGPFHVIGGPVLGSMVDPDLDGQPSVLANADGIDDDGLLIREPLIAGLNGTFTVLTDTGGQLEMFVDFNGNGVFDRTFRETIQRTLTAGTHEITVPIPSTAPESLVVRLRISTTGGLGPTGVALDGEVEDHLVTVYQTPPPMDFGDAPAVYPTLLADDGARHVIEDGLALGSLIDAEPDGQVSQMSTGDGRDDDGVVFRELLIPGENTTIQVHATADGVLDYFIDFDADGVFGNDPSEVFSTPLNAGVQDVSFVVPAGAVLGATMARFRVSESGGLAATGLAFGGEVEDYQLLIVEDTSDPSLENFDRVTVPALPSGWLGTSVGNSWVTESGSGQFGSQSAFVPNPGFVSEAILDSPKFLVEVSNATVRFQNSYNTEYEFDGGVLELSIDEGPFVDVLAAGGFFLTGGYTGTIDTGFQNPLASRPAWTGDSNGLVNTVVQLPPEALGNEVVLRWRFGSDASVDAEGWRIDSIRYDGPALRFDYGDAVDQSPSGSLPQSSLPPAHIVGALTLGANVDADTGALPTADADGDDLDGIDDEDGVVFPLTWVQGDNVVTLQSSGDGIVNLWIDADANGFDSSGDHFIKDLRVTAGSNDLIVAIPSLGTDGFPEGATARVRISQQAGLSHGGVAGDGEVEDYLVGTPSVDAVQVESVVVNDGSDQRGQVTELNVTFSEDVMVPAEAFTVVNRSDGSSVSLGVTTNLVQGKTVASITFVEGSNVLSRPSGNSLVDGRFELVIHHEMIERMESEYRFGDQESDSFFRLFGDSDGDQDVDGRDMSAFSPSFLKSSSDPEFDEAYDYDGDGDVDGRDHSQFGIRFGTSLS